MAGWTAASLWPSSLINQVVNPQVKPGQVLTPEQKLRLSGGVTRRAFNEPAPAPSSVVTPGATGPGASAAAGTGTVIIPGATSGANSATSVVPAATNASAALPPFLQGGANQNLPGQTDVATLLEQILSAVRPQQDPDLTKAQTVLAQQQAMQVARGNEAARQREASQAAMGYLRSQMKDAAKYTTGSVGNILMQKYSDRAKVLRDEGELNWLNMPASSYSVPRRSGWTGPAMPGGWAI